MLLKGKTVMNYKEIRPFLQTGDIVGVRHPENILGTATQYFTNSPYTHVGIIVRKRQGNGVWLAELNSGKNHLIPMSQLKDKQFDIFQCPVSNQTHIASSIDRWLRYPIHYGFKNFILIGLNSYIGVKIPPIFGDELVCSGFVLRILQTAGWDVDMSPLLSPGELLSNFVLKYQINQPVNATMLV